MARPGLDLSGMEQSMAKKARVAKVADKREFCVLPNSEWKGYEWGRFATQMAQPRNMAILLEGREDFARCVAYLTKVFPRGMWQRVLASCESTAIPAWCLALVVACCPDLRGRGGRQLLDRVLVREIGAREDSSRQEALRRFPVAWRTWELPYGDRLPVFVQVLAQSHPGVGGASALLFAAGAAPDRRIGTGESLAEEYARLGKWPLLEAALALMPDERAKAVLEAFPEPHRPDDGEPGEVFETIVEKYGVGGWSRSSRGGRPRLKGPPVAEGSRAARLQAEADYLQNERKWRRLYKNKKGGGK